MEVEYLDDEVFDTYNMELINFGQKDSETYKENSVNTVSSNKKKQSCKKKKASFTTTEKKLLAASVKEHEEIWNLQNENHFNCNAISKAWREISLKLNRPVEDCKAIWSSLRDGRRYRAKVAKQRKSGSAFEELILEPSLEDDAHCWEFAEDLSFLPDVATKRRTISTSTVNSTQSFSETNEQVLRDCSNYSYSSTGSRKGREKAGESAAKLADSIEKLVSLRQQSVGHTNLKHYTMLASIDRMLQKLPDEAVEELNVKIVNLIYSKMMSINNSDD